MSDSMRPSSFRRGQPIRTDWLNRVGANILQNVRIVGGGMRRIGTSLVIDVTPRRGGGSAEPFTRAVISDCEVLDGGGLPILGLVKVRKQSGPLASPTTDTEDLIAWLPNGAWTRYGMQCLIAPLADCDDAEWVIRDIVDYGEREAASGSPSYVSGVTLAGNQLLNDAVDCAGS